MTTGPERRKPHIVRFVCGIRPFFSFSPAHYCQAQQHTMSSSIITKSKPHRRSSAMSSISIEQPPLLGLPHEILEQIFLALSLPGRSKLARVSSRSMWTRAFLTFNRHVPLSEISMPLQPSFNIWLYLKPLRIWTTLAFSKPSSR